MKKTNKKTTDSLIPIDKEVKTSLNLINKTELISYLFNEFAKDVNYKNVRFLKEFQNMKPDNRGVIFLNHGELHVFHAYKNRIFIFYKVVDFFGRGLKIYKSVNLAELYEIMDKETPNKQ